MNIFQLIAAWCGRDYVLVQHEETQIIEPVTWMKNIPFVTEGKNWYPLQPLGHLIWVHPDLWLPLTPRLRNWREVRERFEAANKPQEVEQEVKVEQHSKTYIGPMPPDEEVIKYLKKAQTPAERRAKYEQAKRAGLLP